MQPSTHGAPRRHPNVRGVAQPLHAVTDPAAAAQVCEAFDTELAGGTGTGMRPHRGTDGALWFHQLWEITTAHKT